MSDAERKTVTERSSMSEPRIIRVNDFDYVEKHPEEGEDVLRCQQCGRDEKKLYRRTGSFASTTDRDICPGCVFSELFPE
jgi:hypothetical protein